MTTHYNACAELLDRNVAEGRGNKIAFIDPQQQITYDGLMKASARVANLLRAHGLRREDRVIIVMLDTIDWPAVFLGAIRAGVVPVPLNTLLPVETYRYMLADSRAKALFVSSALYGSVAPALAGLSELDNVFCVGRTHEGGALDYDALMQQQADEFSPVGCSPDDIAFWLYSSGSTGAPKGTKHVQSSLMETAKLYGQGVLGIREDDVCLSAAKFFFAYGLGNSLSFPMSVGATTILNPDRPTPALMYQMLSKFQPTLFFGVPTLYAAMLGDASLDEEKGSPQLRLCASAGEALPEHIGSTWKKRFGSDILDGVGSTEILHIFLSNAPDDVVYGTSGRAVPGYDLRLLDDALQPVADGDVGELYVRGPSAAEGYWNQREKSRATFQGEWTRTGDKYTRDSSHRYTYCGRADDMFKVSGIWVSPFEIEAALASHPAVLEAAVVAKADEDGLLKPKAFIILKQGASTDNLDVALKEHVKKAAGAWKYPRWIEVMDSLPKTATGKIQRFKLRDPV